MARTDERKRFQYKDRSDKQYEKRAAEKGYAKRDGIFKDDVIVFSPKVDEKNRIRILPPTWEDPEHYGFDVWVHYGIGGNNSAYLCLNKMKNERCPICESIATKEAQKDPVYVKKMRPKRKVLVYLIDRSDEESGPKVWAMPFGVDKNYVLQSKDDDTGAILRIDHPDNGYDISFLAPKSKTPDVAYTYEGETIARKSTPISSDQEFSDMVLDRILDIPLPETLKYYEYDYIKTMFEGAASSEQAPETDEVDETPPPEKDEEDEVSKKRESLRARFGR